MDRLPELLPDDLRHRLETVLGFRYHGAADLYAAFREWFEASCVNDDTGSSSVEDTSHCDAGGQKP